MNLLFYSGLITFGLLVLAISVYSFLGTLKELKELTFMHNSKLVRLKNNFILAIVSVIFICTSYSLIPHPMSTSAYQRPCKKVKVEEVKKKEIDKNKANTIK